MRVTFLLGTTGITAIVVSLMTMFAIDSSLANSDINDKADMAAILSNGQSVYNTTCFACHGKDGRGAIIPGVPDFKSRKGPMNKSDDILHKHIKEGYQSPGSPLAMPPNGGNPTLTDKDIRHVIAFIRKSFTPIKNKN